MSRSHFAVPKQSNGGHVDVTNQSCGSSGGGAGHVSKNYAGWIDYFCCAYRKKMAVGQLFGQPVRMLEGSRGINCDRVCLHQRDMK